MKKYTVARILTMSLGLLWLLDGILQLQPSMFTGVFVSQVLAPNLIGQPHAIAAIVAFGIRVFSVNIFWANLVAAIIQLVIGTLLILPLFGALSRLNSHRFALWLSLFWALVVWIFGEGFGGFFTGSATFFTGAPGAALLYAVLALFLLDAMNEEDDETHREDSAHRKADPLQKLPAAAGVIFLIGAALNLMPMFWQPGMLSMLASVPALSGWLGAFGAQGTMLGNFLGIDVLAAIGIFLLLLPRNRAVAWTTLIFLLSVWWIGQNFGGVQTFPFGTATDPNSAPLLILFLVPMFF